MIGLVALIAATVGTAGTAGGGADQGASAAKQELPVVRAAAGAASGARAAKQAGRASSAEPGPRRTRRRVVVRVRVPGSGAVPGGGLAEHRPSQESRKVTAHVTGADAARNGAHKASPAAIPPAHRADSRGTTVAKIVAFARKQLGKPYSWGGTGPSGFDCSGLMQGAFGSVGVHLPRGSIAQASLGRRVSRGQLAPGDLVFSNGFEHVQLYIGGGDVIEAARTGTRVRIASLLPARMINAYVRLPLG